MFWSDSTSRPSPPAHSGAEYLVLAVIASALAYGGFVWLAGEVAGWLFGGAWPQVSMAEAGQMAVRVFDHLAEPGRAWPASEQHLLPHAAGFYAVAAVLVVSCGVLAGVLWLSWHRFEHRGGQEGGARWARAGELRALRVRGARPGRVVLGRRGRRLLAAERCQAVLALSPTRTYKTTGLGTPAVLEWRGPVVAVSVKNDVLADTVAYRRSLGEVMVYDPTAITGESAATWTPLARCGSWLGAQRTASWLCEASRPSRGGLADADFWYAAAAKLLAPMLFGAATAERSMRDVVRWVDCQEQREVDDALAKAGVPEAQAAMQATWQREAKQRSSIYTTAETVLAAYADPNVAASAEGCELDFERFLDGGSHTIYLCAPGHEQRRLQALFSTLLQQLMMAAYEKAVGQKAPIDPALLLVVDEAANIAPLSNLDQIASTAASHGVQLISIFQDLSQIAARYGRERANTIVNNHRAKLIGSGISDPATLQYVSGLLGDERVPELSDSRSEHGRTLTRSSAMRRLAPPNVLRETQPGAMVLIYGHLPPLRIKLRPWFEERALRRRANWRNTA